MVGINAHQYMAKSPSDETEILMQFFSSYGRRTCLDVCHLPSFYLTFALALLLFVLIENKYMDLLHVYSISIDQFELTRFASLGLTSLSSTFSNASLERNSSNPLDPHTNEEHPPSRKLRALLVSRVG